MKEQHPGVRLSLKAMFKEDPSLDKIKSLTYYPEDFDGSAMSQYSEKADPKDKKATPQAVTPVEDPALKKFTPDMIQLK
jgi:hypothetical protein